MSEPKAFPGLGSASDRPRVNPKANVARTIGTPDEYFVLSRIDGHTSYEQLCAVSGLSEEATLKLLRRFREAGLLLAPGEPPFEPPVAGGAAVTGAVTSSGPKRPGTSLLERLDDGSPIADAELAGAPDLPDDTKRRILRLHRRLKKIASHELLGVDADADAAALKRAYFNASKELHPDRFFGKNLGPFRGYLSDLFTQLSRAFEGLEAKRRGK